MLKLRLYEPGDFGPCLDLLRQGHDGDFNAERFRWLHEAGPGGASAIAVAVDRERVVGIYSVVRKVMSVDGRICVGGRDVDPVVHPDYRGQGLFSRLLKFGLANFSGIDFYFNFANAASEPGFRKSGWQQILQLSDIVYQLGFTSPLSVDFLVWLLQQARRPAHARGPVSRVAADEAARMMREDARFLAGRPAAGGIATLRDARYALWRYLECPLHDYEYFVCEPDSRSASLAVCRARPDAGRLEIVDLFGFGGEPRLSDWVGTWAREHRGLRATAWHTLPARIAAPFVANPLRRQGGLPLLVRQADKLPPPAGIFEGRNWFITRGDLEVS